jgi:hypothetical protein
METIQGVLELVESIRGDGVTTCNLAEIKECGEAFDNLRRYMTSNGGEVDLNGVINMVEPS